MRLFPTFIPFWIWNVIDNTPPTATMMTMTSSPRHVIIGESMQTPIPLKVQDDLLRSCYDHWPSLSPSKQEKETDTVLLRFTNDKISFPETNKASVDISLVDIARSILLQQQTTRSLPIPRHHIFPPSHFRRYTTDIMSMVYGMPYADYCLLEERLSQIISSYLLDQKRHFHILLPASYLSGDSIRSYMTREAVHNTLWIAPSADLSPDIVLLQAMDQDIASM